MKSPVMTSGRFFDFCKILESSNATIAKPNISPESSEHIEGRSMFRLNLENRNRHNFRLLVIFLLSKVELIQEMMPILPRVTNRNLRF